MISLSNLRRALGITTEDDAFDLESVKAQIVETWEELTKRKWDRRVDLVENFRQNSDNILTLWPSLWPIEAISKVEVRAYSMSPDWTTLDPSEYEIVGDNDRTAGIRRLIRPWPLFARVTYTGGYTPSPTVGQFKTPFMVEQALIIQARFIRQRTSPDNILVKQKSVARAITVYEDADVHPFFKRVATEKVRKV